MKISETDMKFPDFTVIKIADVGGFLMDATGPGT